MKRLEFDGRVFLEERFGRWGILRWFGLVDGVLSDPREKKKSQRPMYDKRGKRASDAVRGVSLPKAKRRPGDIAVMSIIGALEAERSNRNAVDGTRHGWVSPSTGFEFFFLPRDV